MSELEYRTIDPDELEAWVKALESSFGGVAKPEYLELERMVAHPDRYVAAFDDGRIVGGNSSIPVELTVPGGSRPTVSAINTVGVTPGATRRGISTELMRRQLEATRERGEPLAILHASEAAIYGRYGFGVATRNASLTIDAKRARFARGVEPPGRVRLVDRDDGIAAYTAARAANADRPGWIGPAERYAEWYVRGMEVDDDFGGAKDEPPFFAVHEHDGDAAGVAIYRIKHSWPDEIPQNTAVVYDVATRDPQAHAAIWAYLLGLDLVATAEIWSVPADEPLFRLVREPRALRMKLRDGLHVAFVDLAAAFEARSFAADGRIRLGVHDAFSRWNEGTWELVVEDGRGTCRPTDADPDLELTSTDLASTYLGDATFAELAAALRVRGDAEAITRADALTATRRTPWSWLGV